MKITNIYVMRVSIKIMMNNIKNMAEKFATREFENKTELLLLEEQNYLLSLTIEQRELYFEYKSLKLLEYKNNELRAKQKELIERQIKEIEYQETKAIKKEKRKDFIKILVVCVVGILISASFGIVMTAIKNYFWG